MLVVVLFFPLLHRFRPGWLRRLIYFPSLRALLDLFTGSFPDLPPPAGVPVV